MARYRKIEPRIWNDLKFRTLTDHGKLTFFFLLTHPHMTSLGAMRASLAGLASEMGWAEKAFREAFGEAFDKGMVKYDGNASMIWLPQFLNHNRPESPNVVKAWAVALELLPECELLYELIQHVKAFAEALPEAFAEALPEAFDKAMPYQEQEQEQDKTSCPKSELLGDRVNGHDYFGEFWMAYPRKVGKGAAEKAWKKLKRPKETLTQIITALSWQSRSDDWTRDQGKFIPHPATYLNQGRWQDEPIKPAETPRDWI